MHHHGVDLLVYAESSQNQTASCVDGFTDLKESGKNSEPSSTAGGCIDAANDGDNIAQCRVIDEVGNAFSKSNEDSEAAVEESANKVEDVSQEKDTNLDESQNNYALDATTSDKSILRNSTSMVTIKNRRGGDAESETLRNGNCSREHRNSLAERSGAELGKVMSDSRKRTRPILPVKWNYAFHRHGTIAQRKFFLNSSFFFKFLQFYLRYKYLLNSFRSICAINKNFLQKKKIYDGSCKHFQGKREIFRISPLILERSNICVFFSH